MRRHVIALGLIVALNTPVLAWAEDQAITVGSWTISTSSRGDKFDNCTMRRSTNEIDASFIRDQSGLLLLLESPKWRLERGKVYPVKLIAGSRSIDAKAAAEAKGVTISLTDPLLSEKMRTANVFEIVGEGATLRVPLDGSTAALARLEACFEKNSRQSTDVNPFVAPNHKP
jgi:invasion protein IalB